MKNKINLFTAAVLMAIALLALPCHAQEEKGIGTGSPEGYPGVQLKSFYTTSVNGAETEANTWLKANPKIKVVSVVLTTTPEPAQFYNSGNYPGFKYAIVITY